MLNTQENKKLSIQTSRLLLKIPPQSAKSETPMETSSILILIQLTSIKNKKILI